MNYPFPTRVAALKRLPEWARACAYPVDAVGPIVGPPSVDASIARAAPSIERAHEVALQEAATPAAVVRAADVTVCCWNWDGARRPRQYKYLLFNAQGDLKIDDVNDAPQWLQVLPPVLDIDATTCCLMTSPWEPPVRQTDADYVFVGGISHFGHWFLDSLSVLRVLEWDPTLVRCTFVFTALERWQRFCLEKLFPELRILEIDAGAALASSLHFASLRVIERASVWERYAFLRRRLRAFRREAEASPSRLVYLRRGVVHGERRVDNELEIEAALMRLGFEVVDTDAVPIERAADFYGSCRIVVCPPSSANTNFFLFCPATAWMVQLVEESTLNGDPGSAIGAYYYHVPFLDRISYVVGRARQPARGAYPCTFDVHAVVRAAEAALDAPPIRPGGGLERAR